MAKKRKKNRGGVLVTVLFVIMAITVIALGLFARTDMHLACAKNFTTRVQIDALAYSGLEHARALIMDPNNGMDFSVEWTSVPFQLDLDEDEQGLYEDYYYELTVSQWASDPNTYTVTSYAYKEVSSQPVAKTTLSGTVCRNPDTSKARYLSINRVR